jgi:hypothetical protein
MGGEKGSITTIETIKTKQTLKAQIAERQIPMLNRPRISRYEPPIQKGTVDPDPHRTEPAIEDSSKHKKWNAN